jgi:hypothetical protein
VTPVINAFFIGCCPGELLCKINKKLQSQQLFSRSPSGAASADPIEPGSLSRA